MGVFINFVKEKKGCYTKGMGICVCVLCCVCVLPVVVIIVVVVGDTIVVVGGAALGVVRNVILSGVVATALVA